MTTMENKKQEAIRKAYGEYYELAKPFMDENGWIDRLTQSPYLNIGKWGLENPPPIINILGNRDSGGIEYQTNSIYWRPVVLHGIETNNGWKELPTKEFLPHGWYFVKLKHPVTEIEDVTVYHLKEGAGILPYAFGTHYKPIELNLTIY